MNNAGVAVFKRIGESTWEDWKTVLNTNLDGPFLCTQAAAPLMLRGGRGGAVVNIASISGLRASTMRVAYGTSKAAIIHLIRQQAIECGNAGLRVNCVAPGPVDTEMSKLVHSVAIRSDYCDAIPLNRYGSTDEIASAVGWLCSAEASCVNAQAIAVAQPMISEIGPDGDAVSTSSGSTRCQSNWRQMKIPASTVWATPTVETSVAVAMPSTTTVQIT